MSLRRLIGRVVFARSDDDRWPFPWSGHAPISKTSDSVSLPLLGFASISVDVYDARLFASLSRMSQCSAHPNTAKSFGLIFCIVESALPPCLIHSNRHVRYWKRIPSPTATWIGRPTQMAAIVHFCCIASSEGIRSSLIRRMNRNSGHHGPNRMARIPKLAFRGLRNDRLFHDPESLVRMGQA